MSKTIYTDKEVLDMLKRAYRSGFAASTSDFNGSKPVVKSLGEWHRIDRMFYGWMDQNWDDLKKRYPGRPFIKGLKAGLKKGKKK